MFCRKEEITAIPSAYIPADDLDMIRRRLDKESRALVDILRLSGYRVDDLMYSREYQWYMRDGTVTLYERKTKQQRTVPATPELREAVERYKSVRWITRHPQPLTFFVQGKRDIERDLHKRHRSTLYRHFAEAVRQAGLAGKGYTLHSLRKCYAVDRYNESGLLSVQKDLGHKSISTTCLYVFGSRADM